MKHLITICILFVSAFSFAQDTGSIQGYLLDVESNNAPLLYAKALIKETGAEALSDENGVFEFKNLKAGNYTLVSSFTGYETKETAIKIETNKSTKIKLQLKADSIALEDLMATLTTAEVNSKDVDK